MTNTFTLPANRSIPDSPVIPVLTYEDLETAIEWLCRTFGFTERLRIGDHRSQLVYGGGAIVAAERPDGFQPQGGMMTTHSLLVRVPDVDRHYAKVQASGAAIVSPPADYPFGERQYSATDCGGHRWTFSQTIADVNPADWGGILR